MIHTYAVEREREREREKREMSLSKRECVYQEVYLRDINDNAEDSSA